MRERKHVTVDELLSRYTAGERDFSSVRFVSPGIEVAIVRDIILQDANLGDIDLIGVDMARANLNNVFMEQRRLEDVNLCGANLRDIFLFLGTLINVDLSGADLSNADLTHASLRRVQGCGTSIWELLDSQSRRGRHFSLHLLPLIWQQVF
jgi:uncharacterized protein YjbI with pentapeptide repeats